MLVTGATGFIGRHLARALVKSGATVHGLSRSTRKGSENVSHIVCDLADGARLAEIVDAVRPTLVFHLASNKKRSADISAIRQTFCDNVIGALNLVEACAASGCHPRLVAVGSCEEYGAAPAPYCENGREVPVSAYSYSKLATTQLLQTLNRTQGLPVVILRPSLVYGPEQGEEMFLPALIRSLLRSQRFAMSPGEQTRDYVFVDDVVESLLAAARCSGIEGHVINIASGSSIRIIDLARAVAAQIGEGCTGLLDIGETGYRPGEPMDYRIEPVKARRLLGWSPRVSINDGLTRTIESYRRAGMG